MYVRDKLCQVDRLGLVKNRLVRALVLRRLPLFNQTLERRNSRGRTEGRKWRRRGEMGVEEVHRKDGKE